MTEGGVGGEGVRDLERVDAASGLLERPTGTVSDPAKVVPL